MNRTGTVTAGSATDFVQFVNQIRRSLRQEPVRLRDIRRKADEIEAFAGTRVMMRTALGEIAATVDHYYPLPELIALYRRQRDCGPNQRAANQAAHPP